MRLIGNFDDKKQAEHFAAYLKTEQVTAHLDLDEKSNTWELWVKEEDHFKKSLAAFGEFQRDPKSAQFQGVVEKAKTILRDEEKQRARIQKNVVKVSHRPASKRATLTILTIVISALVALMTNFGQTKNGPAFRAMSFNGISVEKAESLGLTNEMDTDSLAFRTASIRAGQVWRMVTPIFIHFTVLHLVFNMYCFFYFGQMIENRYGTVCLALLIVGIGIISNLGQGIAPFDLGGSVPFTLEGFFLSNFGGMSGVVYGLFGFVWMKTIFDPNCRMFLSQLTVMMLVGWLFFCMLPGQEELTGTSYGNWAHGVGLVAGMAVGYLMSMGKG